MVAAVIWTHWVREAMSESLHRFDWGKNRLFFSRFDWFNSFKEVCVNPDFRVNQKGVRDVEESNDTFENLVLASLQGSQRWQRSLNPLATLHQWDRPRLGRWHLHPAGRQDTFIILWISPAFYVLVNLFRSPPRWQTNLVQRESPRSESVLFWHSQPEFPSQRV